MKKKILLGLLFVLVAIQLWHSPENKATSVAADAIQNRYPVPENVQAILKKACNDCHSSNTEYPWYNHIQPINWFVAKHVNDGKRHLNFDAFLSYSYKKQDKKMEELAEQLQEGEMPLASYTLIHQGARLNTMEKQQLLDWAASVRRLIASGAK